MNRARFLTTLAGGVLALPHIAAAATPDEDAIYDLLDAVVDAQFTYDFPRLATMLHPASLGMFRDHLSARFDQLLRSYSLADIISVSGLPNHPKDLELSDAEVFIIACNSTGKRYPDFVGNAKFLPLKIHGTIFDDDRLAHVLYSYSGAVQTERTDFDYIAPGILTMHRERDTWLVRSCILARGIIDRWWRDLAKTKEPERQSG